MNLCLRCNSPLKVMKWNTKGDVLVCGNSICALFHQPQGFNQINQTMKEVVGSDRRKHGRQNRTPN